MILKSTKASWFRNFIYCGVCKRVLKELIQLLSKIFLAVRSKISILTFQMQWKHLSLFFAGSDIDICFLLKLELLEIFHWKHLHGMILVKVFILGNCSFSFTTLFYCMCVFTFLYFLCAHSTLFGMKYTFCFFSILPCFLSYFTNMFL